MKKRAIVRAPGKGYRKCISSHPHRQSVNIPLAQRQHSKYVNTLKELGLDVIQLPEEDDLPDSCFVEDTAVIVGSSALMTRPRYSSRQQEVESIASLLNSYLRVEFVREPATLEGGDVIHLPDCLISGVTERTNLQGIGAMQRRFSLPVHQVEDPSIVHLKSYVTYLGNDRFIGTEKYREHRAFAQKEYLLVPQSESYAANTLEINGAILIPVGYPLTEEMLEEQGLDTIPLETSEFAKCEGALTCLSLLF
jgi:dimethylargininase